MKKKCFVAIAPENGWDNICAIVLANNVEEVWEYLANQNVGETVAQLKKEKYYFIRQHTITEI